MWGERKVHLIKAVPHTTGLRTFKLLLSTTSLKHGGQTWPFQSLNGRTLVCRVVPNSNHENL